MRLAIVRSTPPAAYALSGYYASQDLPSCPLKRLLSWTLQGALVSWASSLMHQVMTLNAQHLRSGTRHGKVESRWRITPWSVGPLTVHLRCPGAGRLGVFGSGLSA